MYSRKDKYTADAYGTMRQYYAQLGVSPLLINQYLPANLYATADREEIAAQKLIMIRALR